MSSGDPASVTKDEVVAALAGGHARRWGRSIWPTGLFGPMAPADHPTAFHASAGLIASASDYAILASVHERQFGIGPDDAADAAHWPYRLGWFVQVIDGVRIKWHHGQWYTSSALVIVVPDAELAMVALANSDDLSRGYRLGDVADVTRSPLSRALFGIACSEVGVEALCH